MTSLLCLVAHPDDETMLCGGTLALLAANGVAVHLALLTRGEGGEMGEPPLSEREHLGEVREREMVCAVGKLGARASPFWATWTQLSAKTTRCTRPSTTRPCSAAKSSPR